MKDKLFAAAITSEGAALIHWSCTADQRNDIFWSKNDSKILEYLCSLFSLHGVINMHNVDKLEIFRVENSMLPMPPQPQNKASFYFKESSWCPFFV